MQCDVYTNPHDRDGTIPYLLNVQADLLDELATRVVVPLIRAEHFGRPARGLHPAFEIAGNPVVMATHLLAAVPRGELGAIVASLSDHRPAIIAAVDILLAGV